MNDTPLLTTADLAKRLGWTTDRTNRWIRAQGLGTKRGGRWYTTPTQIRAAFPELFVELFGPEAPTQERRV